MIRREINILSLAIMFYTRIPMPKSIGYSSENMSKSIRYFPFIGYLVGGLGALLLYLGQFLFSVDVTIVLAMVGMALLTGAFHEDSFADFCDGFGGGYDKEKILKIMKDSQIGTYGAVGLIFLLLTKFLLLRDQNPESLILTLIAAHVFSRFSVVFFMHTSWYAGNMDASKTKDVGQQRSIFTVLFVTLWVIPFFFLLNPLLLLFVLSVYVPLVLYFRYYVHKHVGGYTGDILGALQQLTELSFYASSIVFLLF